MEQVDVSRLRFDGFDGEWEEYSLEDIAEGITSGKSNFKIKHKDKKI